MTVSRALTGSDEVSAKTRERVLERARELGYRPNRWARSLVTRRSSIIGVVIPDIEHSFFAEITAGVEEIIEPAGYNLLLCHSRGDIARETSALSMLVGSHVDGLIVATVHPALEAEEFVRLREMGIPFVLIDRLYPKEEFWGVGVDDRAVGRLATEHLIDLNHRRIAHICGPSLSPGLLRHKGYLSALKKHGIEANRDWILRGTFYADSGGEAMRRLLETRPRPTAVFAANDPMAIGAVYACRDAGLRVPEDISVIGAGNIEGSLHPNPFLTTVDWPRQDLGRTAARMLLNAIKHPRHRPETTLFEPRVLVRQSAAKLGTSAGAADGRDRERTPLLVG